MRAPSPAETAHFQGLCGPVSHEERGALRSAVQAHLLELRRAARGNELLPVDLAEVLASRLDRLLGQLDSLPAEAGALVVGAARYFVSEEDAIPDTGDVLGLDDDVAVFNAVVRRIGRAELVIVEATE